MKIKMKKQPKILYQKTLRMDVRRVKSNIETRALEIKAEEFADRLNDEGDNDEK